MGSYIITVHFLSTSRNVAVCSHSLMTTKVNCLVTLCFLIWCFHMYRENFHSSDYFTHGEFRRSNKEVFKSIFSLKMQSFVTEEMFSISCFGKFESVVCFMQCLLSKEAIRLLHCWGYNFFFLSSNCKAKQVKPKT